MLASLAAAAVIALCPPAAPVAPVADPDAPAPEALVACVGATAITGQLFSHWLAISQKGSAGATAEVLRRQVMEFLVSGKWIEGEAEDRDIRISDREVRHRLTAQKHQAFPNEREFRQFLEDTGMTRSDLKYRVRLEILSERVRKAASGSGSAATQQRRLTRFLRRFRVKWTRRTSCLANYAIESCGSTLPTVTP